MSKEQFGKLLTQGLKSIAALEKTDLSELQYELGREIGISVWTLYKWRKNTSIPSDDRTLAILARACVQRGHMGRQWLADFLSCTIYSNKSALLNELYPESDAIVVTHNLPRRQHKKLIGRENELHDIQTFLSARHRVGVVCISGSGGVGKSALALEVAHSCHESHASLQPDERFDAIIWVTAKNVELLSAGQIEREPTFTDLDSVYRAIADLLDIPAIFRTATQAEKNIIAMRLLAEKRVLLILDNLEDVDDPSLFVFLRDLPAPSKAVVTSRHRIDVAVPIFLHTLDEETAYELACMECERHSLSISEAEVQLLLQKTGGLPLAIIRTIGRMVWRGSNIETEIAQLNDPKNEIYDFCFSKTITLIQLSDAYQLFSALAVFNAKISRSALGFVAGFEDNILRRDEGLSDLEVLSLCYKEGDHYCLEPLTRMQALTELHAHPEFETVSRDRWVKWYLKYTNTYGGRDEYEMHLRYDYLEEDWNNILSVIRWCIDEMRYEDTVALWCNIRDFTHIYGYWADRVSLLTWIIHEAKNRGEWQTAVQAMYDKAFTMTLTGPLSRHEEAEGLLQDCWNKREVISPIIEARVAALMASLYIKFHKHEEAHQWLATGESLLQNAHLEPLELARERTSLLFDKGENWFTLGDYANARKVFEEMLQQGQISGWQRSIAHAQNWLAYVAVLQGDLEMGEQYLRLGWAVADRIKEQRVQAYFKRTFAHYYLKRGNSVEALKWAEAACDSFERLGMPPDMRAMRELILNLKAD
ncbi:MAG: AAA family ATPase [Anaerolineaceae bacterium]|nr:AAA family ATPase [Anaerolineaceae bacterium]